MTVHTLTWPEFRARYHPDAERPRDHRLQREADMTGEAVEIVHPSHGWVLERIEPEV